MDATSFCGMMQTEIASLKARVYDIMQTVEKTKDKKKKTLAPQIDALHALIEHLSEMNDRLAKECPLDWSREKEEIEAKKAELIEEIDIWDSEHLAGLVDN
jgi:ABC-type phosphate transport system auxiliary subunit